MCRESSFFPRLLSSLFIVVFSLHSLAAQAIGLPRMGTNQHYLICNPDDPMASSNVGIHSASGVQDDQGNGNYQMNATCTMQRPAPNGGTWRNDWGFDIQTSFNASTGIAHENFITNHGETGQISYHCDGGDPFPAGSVASCEMTHYSGNLNHFRPATKLLPLMAGRFKASVISQQGSPPPPPAVPRQISIVTPEMASSTEADYVTLKADIGNLYESQTCCQVEMLWRAPDESFLLLADPFMLSRAQLLSGHTIWRNFLAPTIIISHNGNPNINAIAEKINAGKKANGRWFVWINVLNADGTVDQSLSSPKLEHWFEFKPQPVIQGVPKEKITLPGSGSLSPDAVKEKPAVNLGGGSGGFVSPVLEGRNLPDSPGTDRGRLPAPSSAPEKLAMADFEIEPARIIAPAGNPDRLAIEARVHNRGTASSDVFDVEITCQAIVGSCPYQNHKLSTVGGPLPYKLAPGNQHGFLMGAHPWNLFPKPTTPQRWKISLVVTGGRNETNSSNNSSTYFFNHLPQLKPAPFPGKIGGPDSGDTAPLKPGNTRIPEAQTGDRIRKESVTPQRLKKPPESQNIQEYRKR